MHVDYKQQVTVLYVHYWYAICIYSVDVFISIQIYRYISVECALHKYNEEFPRIGRGCFLEALAGCGDDER